jgi:hypothetical protein
MPDEQDSARLPARDRITHRCDGGRICPRFPRMRQRTRASAPTGLSGSHRGSKPCRRRRSCGRRRVGQGGRSSQGMTVRMTASTGARDTVQIKHPAHGAPRGQGTTGSCAVEPGSAQRPSPPPTATGRRPCPKSCPDSTNTGENQRTSEGRRRATQQEQTPIITVSSSRLARYPARVRFPAPPLKKHGISRAFLLLS